KRDLIQATHQRYAGIVHQQRGTAEITFHLADEVLNGSSFGDINGIGACRGISRQKLARLFQTCGVEIGEGELRAALAKFLRQSASDSGSCSGNDRYGTNYFLHGGKDSKRLPESPKVPKLEISGAKAPGP